MMISFPRKRPEEAVPLCVGFRKHVLQAGETIANATVTTSVRRGTDPAHAAILASLRQIDGDDVIQPVIGGVEGVDYWILMAVTTSTGRVLEFEFVLPVRRVR